MIEREVLVIGGGPAGVSAAVAIARRGIRVRLVEQRDRLGGAIYREFSGRGASAVYVPPRHKAAWAAAMRDLDAVGDRVTQQRSSVFVGVDGNGLALIDDLTSRTVSGIRPAALVVAIGAMERVLPRPGWDSPGVVTAGGMQVQIKETGSAPPGRILLAGSGPLLLALAAQLCSIGRPPVAILDAGDPVKAAFASPRSLATLLSSWPHVCEAATFAMRIARAGVAYRRNWRIEEIGRRDGVLTVKAGRSGRPSRTFSVEHLALHDGILPNRLRIDSGWLGDVPVEHVGDCREIRGAEAAAIDGRLAGEAVAARLLGETTHDAGPGSPRLAKALRLQHALERLCAADAPVTTDTTTLCLCERRSLADLRAFPAGSSTREVRLVGRFGMGACQGRFCASSVREASADLGIEAGELDGFAPRWPTRPVAVSALASFENPDR